MAEPTSSGSAPPTSTTAAPAPETAAAAADQALARSSTVMAAGTAVSRVLGFVRAAVLASAIGAAGIGADAFNVSNTIPNTLYLLIAGGLLNAVLVPQVVRAMARPDGGAEYLDRLVTAAVLAFATVTVVLVAASPLLIAVFANQYSGHQRSLAVAFAVWCLPQVFFYALYTLLGQVLNAKGRYGAYMWAPVVNNVIAIAGVAVLIAVRGADPGGVRSARSWSDLDVAVLAGSATLGVVVQSLVLLVPLRRAGVRLRPRFGLRGVGLRSTGQSAVWVLASLGVGNLALLGVTNVSTSATGPGTPGYAAWGLAYLVFMLPHSLVVVSLVTALFTRMSTAAAAGDRAGVRRDVSTGLRTIGVATVLASSGLLVLGVAAGVVIADDPVSGRGVGRVITAMACGLVPFSTNYLLQRAFYAFEDARTPFITQCVSGGVWLAGTLLSGLLLPDPDKVVGIAASMATGQACAAVLGFVLLRRRLGGLDGRRVLRTHVRLVLAALLAAAAGVAVTLPMGGLVDAGRWGAAVVAAAGGLLMVAVYGAGLKVLHVEEVQPLLRRLTRR